MLHEDPEECTPQVRLAIERDGALYDVAELDRIFDTAYAPDRFAGAGDFHTRVIALRGAGLDALDDRLRRGERPSEARLLPDAVLWLPPRDPDRALFVQMASPRVARAAPSFRFENARALVGHAGRVIFPADEGRPDYELGVAAILAEDLERATPRDAEAAILGFAILNGWCGRDAEDADPSAARLVAAQLGPVLVTADDIEDLARLRAQVRVDRRVVISADLGGWTFSAAESIAWASRHTPLRAGDVIGLGCVASGASARALPAWGSDVELLVERLGKLSGQPIRG